jgi:hypothetical protein
MLGCERGGGGTELECSSGSEDKNNRRHGPLRALPASKRSTKGPSSITIFRRGRYHPGRQSHHLLHNQFVLLLLEDSEVLGRSYDLAFLEEPQLGGLHASQFESCKMSATRKKSRLRFN